MYSMKSYIWFGQLSALTGLAFSAGPYWDSVQGRNNTPEHKSILSYACYLEFLES